MRLLDAAWSEGRDITSDSVISEIADDIGLNGQELLAQASEIKERLRLQTKGAIQAGVFGVPSVTHFCTNAAYAVPEDGGKRRRSYNARRRDIFDDPSHSNPTKSVKAATV